MRVLHVCADYGNQALYGELFSKLGEVGVSGQMVYVAKRGGAEIATDSVGDWDVETARVLRHRHRLLFASKVRIIQESLRVTAESFRPDLIHAHFLYSDGVPALAVSRAIGVPLVVSVRNTDLNFFARFRPDLDGHADAVFGGAAATVFLTPAYKTKAINRYRRSSLSGARVVPNGMSDFWLENTFNDPNASQDHIRVCFVGELTKNKNVLGLIAAFNYLAIARSASLTIVGDGPLRSEVERAAKRSGGDVKVLGRLSNKNDLMEVYRSSTVLAMPSFKETFGISYVEALSQGLPVIHSRGEGVDGLVEEGVTGFAVNPKSTTEIARAIARAHDGRSVTAARCALAARRFDWRLISKELVQIYADSGAR